MRDLLRPVDLTQVPRVPWAWVDEHVYAAIRGCSVKVLQRERSLNIGCTFRRINGTTIIPAGRYYGLSGIAAWRRWRREPLRSTSPRIWQAAQIFNLTISQAEGMNGVRTKFAA